MAIPIAGIFAAFFVGWCASRLVLALTWNVDYSGVCFVLAALATGIAFIYRIWKPLRPAIKRLAAKRD
jgi:hypothetical protein